MNKKLSVVLFIIVTLYAAIFGVIMVITILQPSMAYENTDLLLGNIVNSSNKINYRQFTKDGITTITCKKMTGMETIWKYQANEDMTLQMVYDLKVTNGKAKLVLITPDDTIITLTEQDSAVFEDNNGQASETTKYSDTGMPDMESTVDLNLQKGENRIRIVCRKGTTFSLSFRIIE